jgi:hypothetical protein
VTDCPDPDRGAGETGAAAGRVRSVRAWSQEVSEREREEPKKTLDDEYNLERAGYEERPERILDSAQIRIVGLPGQPLILHRGSPATARRRSMKSKVPSNTVGADRPFNPSAPPRCSKDSCDARAIFRIGDLDCCGQHANWVIARQVGERRQRNMMIGFYVRKT